MDIYFPTGLRNALYNEMLSVGDDGEVVLITLNRPLVCVQPLAVDRAVLVWLNYKNAYEYWTEQRASLNKVRSYIPDNDCTPYSLKEHLQ